MFREADSEGQNKLYNVLLAYSEFNPEVGYCQGMSYIAGLLLMFYSEPESFWILDVDNYEKQSTTNQQSFAHWRSPRCRSKEGTGPQRRR